MKKNALILVMMIIGMCLFAQEPLLAGLDAYARSDWSTAILSFRKASALAARDSEPRYWLVMSELSAGEYDNALEDMERFVADFPAEKRIADMTYQKGRVLYLLGRYEASILSLDRFIASSPEHEMIPSAYYWIGECLYAAGRFDEAGRILSLVLERYPQSVKREAALYRISLIQQGVQEEELLKLLKMSHEESLKIIEDYQRREKTYEQAINAYQKRISEMIKDTRLGELEKQLGEEKVKNSALLDRISALEIRNSELAASLAMSGLPVQDSSPEDLSGDLDSGDPEKRRLALEALRNKAQSLQTMYDQILEGENQ